MGMYRSAYLGPYAEFVLPLKTDRRDMCPQPTDCPNAQSGQFCPRCGMELEKRYHDYQNTDPPMHEILVKVLDEALMNADGVSGPEQPDRNTVIYRLIQNQDDDSVCVEVVSNMVMEEIAWFREAFAPEWEALRELYGNFEFKWGFLQWYL